MISKPNRVSGPGCLGACTYRWLSRIETTGKSKAEGSDAVVIGQIGQIADSPAKPVQLCMFSAELTPSDTFKRTARYVDDPPGYLRDSLGVDTFEARKALLCLPETVDMDRYGGGKHRQMFERHIARLLGKQHGLFFITGVQAQLAALKIHAERAQKRRLAWHVSSHLETAEERAFETLYGLERILLGNDPQALPTVNEIKDDLALPAEERPAAILVETPNRVLGCQTYTFAELQAISAACRNAGVMFHCDGARLWEIEPYYNAAAGKSFADLAALFDTVYLSFYKGMGGVTGAMLVSNDEGLINEAKTWQRRAGGTAFTFGYEIIDDERGFNENIGTFARKRDKMMEIVDGIKEATARYKGAHDRPIVTFLPDRPTCCQILTVFQGFTDDELTAARDRVQEKSNVRVFERLRRKEAVEESTTLSHATAASAREDATEIERHFMEWMMMSVTEKIETSVFVNAYVDLCQELLLVATPK
ncbi:hypothetical protein LTR53_009165 [Teratosphaeriaceae sp. CCFEE 6253]|nr:hypothetical protein LTR53_009165 [Teratosphaeriaceae sp. CCFEE 6253]